MPFRGASVCLAALTTMAVWIEAATTTGLRVGTGRALLEGDDNMIIAGGIGPGKAAGQEGELRCLATVVEKRGQGRIAIVACDILMMERRAWNEWDGWNRGHGASGRLLNFPVIGVICPP